jgi:hypothetical protein
LWSARPVGHFHPAPPCDACSSCDRTTEQNSARGTVPQPWFAKDARWNAERPAVEFGVEIGEYHGVVRVPRRVFQRLLPERPTPERCVEAYYLQRTRFESIAEPKLRPASAITEVVERAPEKPRQ